MLFRLLLFIVLATTANCLNAQPALLPPDKNPTVEVLTSNDDISGVVTEIVRATIPDHYENTKDWNKTKEVWDGLKIRREGFQIKTKRRRKTVNHGTWTRYRLDLADTKQLRIKVDNIVTGDNQVEFDASCSAPLIAFGRLSQWQRDVQLVSLSINATANVELRVHCVTQLKLDPSKFPPDVLFHPHVTSADLELRDFRVSRISDLGGPLAKHLGTGVREVLEDKIEDKRHKLVDKVNRSIDKRQDKLRLSLHDLVTSQWGELAAKYFPTAPAKEIDSEE